MVDLKILQRSKIKPKKRVGRGAGSGRGKTSGRGQKGQKARGKVRLGFEGGQRPLIKRLPYRRGKGNYKLNKKPIIVNLKILNLLESGIVVDLDVLVKKGIVEKESAQKFGVKILGDGKLSIPLKINLPVSKRAIVKIEKAGGKVIFGKNNEGILEKVEKNKSKKKVKK